MRKRDHNAGEGFEDSAESFGDVFLIALPFFSRLQDEVGVGFIEAHWIEADFVRTDPGNNRSHFRHLGQDGLLQPCIDRR